MRIGNPLAPHQSDRQRETDGRALGVDRVFDVDVLDWWCRLTAPWALSWKREVLFLVGLTVGAFALGVVVGIRLLR